MPQFSWLDPSPFRLLAGHRGCLLIHGFTGSPAEMRPLGEYLYERDITALGPCLPGHGTRVEDMQGVTWQNWYQAVEMAYQDLRQHCDQIFAVGFSLGAVLALHLAAQHELAGLIVLSPALGLKDRRSRLVPWLRFVLRYLPKDPDPRHNDLTDPEAYRRFWSYDAHPTWGVYQLLLAQKVVRSELGRIRCPTLVIYSTRDTAIAPDSGPVIYQSVHATEKEMLVLQNSGHGIVADSEHQAVFEKVYLWVVAPAGAAGA